MATTSLTLPSFPSTIFSLFDDSKELIVILSTIFTLIDVEVERIPTLKDSLNNVYDVSPECMMMVVF